MLWFALVAMAGSAGAAAPADGVTRTTTAPRLTVFARHGEEWLMAAHANFTPLDDVPTASPDQ